MNRIASIFLLVFLYAGFSAAAQTAEQYKKWQTDDFREINEYVTIYLSVNDNYPEAYLNKALEKLERALSNDENNPLLLSLAGYVTSIKAKEMFKERTYDAYSSSLLDNEENGNSILEKRRAQACLLDQKAEKYYLRAVDQQESNSMVDLANYYRAGYIYESNSASKFIILYATVKAIPWLKKAQALGNQQAGIILGELYIKGESVPQDIKLGEELIRKEVDEPSQLFYELGVNFVDGYGNPDNHSNSWKKLSQVKPYEYLYDGKVGLYFLTKAANAGNIDARFFLALSYAGMHKDHSDAEWRDKIVTQDMVKAFAFMKKAAVNENDTIYPWYYLALFYLNGTGTPKNTRLGLEMLEKIVNGRNDWDKEALKEMIKKERAAAGR
ncbi:MAG: sel1 repeat family protein [Chitinophagaceae bacterium]|nr:sel1 repeat family protein [Chitinophagaceae bacterium]